MLEGAATDLDLAAETVRRIMNGGAELHAYSRGMGQMRGPAPALGAFVADAGLLAQIVDGGFEDCPALLQAIGIDPDARSGARGETTRR